MEKKKSLEIKSVVFAVLFVICIVITVILHSKMTGENVAYEKVSVKVVEAKKERRITRGKITSVHNVVIVEYNGRNYDLINVRDNEYNQYKSQKEYSLSSEAYYAKDEMYANTEGIKTNTGSSSWYFGFLFLDWFLFLITAMTIGAYYDERKKCQLSQDTGQKS